MAFVSDMVAPILENQSMILAVLLITVILSGVYWLKDAHKIFSLPEPNPLIEPFLTRNLKSVGFFCCLIVFLTSSVLFSLQLATDSEDKGLLSSFVPAAEKIQNTLFSIKKDTKKMATDLEAIKENTAKMAKLYSMEDLNRLAGLYQWKVVLEHIEDISPKNRDQEWMDLYYQASTSYMTDLYEIESDKVAKFNKFKELLLKAPFLRKSKKFMLTSSKISYEWAEDCWRRQENQCFEKLEKHLLIYKDFPVVLLRFAKLASYRVFPRYASPLFLKAFRSGLSNRHCKDERVELIIESIADISTEYEKPLYDATLKIRDKYCQEFFVNKNETTEPSRDVASDTEPTTTTTEQ